MFLAIVRALKRAILGKSSHDYTKQLTGNQEYWDRIMAAQAMIHDKTQASAKERSLRSP